MIKVTFRQNSRDLVVDALKNVKCIYAIGRQSVEFLNFQDAIEFKRKFGKTTTLITTKREINVYSTINNQRKEIIL